MAVYSVSQVLRYLNDILAQDPVVRDFWVHGEVANLTRPGSGHSYFSLRESTTALRCVMFRTQAFGAHLLSDGAAVIAHGRLSLYEARGDLQLIADIVKPEGLGEAQLKLEELKLKLEREGLFAESRKRALPSYPRRIAVVTSPTGAVWHDIQTIVARRYPLVELLLAPASVQGDSAAAEIVDAFQTIDNTPEVDAVIVARGGGSLEDLRAFNEEPVSRAIYASRVPVISAVGHETDVTIADLVADRRAPTPSAAAEMAVPDRYELASRLVGWQQSLSAGIAARVQSRTDAVSHLGGRLRRGRPDIDSARLRIDDRLLSIARHLTRDVERRSERMRGLSSRLESLSPRNTLRRGYAIVQSQPDMAVVSDARNVSIGDQVKVTLARGGLEADVISTRREQRGSSKERQQD